MLCLSLVLFGCEIGLKNHTVPEECPGKGEMSVHDSVEASHSCNRALVIQRNATIIGTEALSDVQHLEGAVLNLKQGPFSGRRMELVFWLLLSIALIVILVWLRAAPQCGQKNHPGVYADK